MVRSHRRLQPRLPDEGIPGRGRPAQRHHTAPAPKATPRRASLATHRVPARCVDVLSELRRQQVTRPGGVGTNGLVFSTAFGGPMDAANVRRAFRSAIRGAEGSLRDSGLPGSSDTASCRCFQIRGCPSKRSPGSWETAAPPRPSWCTASRSARHTDGRDHHGCRVWFWQAQSRG
jgi:hypothetical protein